MWWRPSFSDSMSIVQSVSVRLSRNDSDLEFHTAGQSGTAQS